MTTYTIKGDGIITIECTSKRDAVSTARRITSQTFRGTRVSVYAGDRYSPDCKRIALYERTERGTVRKLVA